MKLFQDYVQNSSSQGFDKKEGGGIELISHIISKQLQIPISVLMGANLASEVAEEMFCETTIGKGRLIFIPNYCVRY